MQTSPPAQPARSARPRPSGSESPAVPTRSDGPDVAAVRYRLGHGLRLVDRGDNTLQVGTDAPRRVILQHAPADAATVLRSLDGEEPVPTLLQRTGADPELWSALFRRLADAGLLGTTGTATDPVLGLAGERAHLTHRYGADSAEMLLARRADAIIEIQGAGRVASGIALQLAASGIGHLHHAPDRPLGRQDLLPPMNESQLPDDRSRLAARLRAVSERIQVSPVAGHQRPSLVVIAGDGPADATATTHLVDDGIPHLAVWAGPSRAVVGPLVLPGMSSCLWCAELSRVDADDGWPLVRQVVHGQPLPPATVLAAGAAALATAEILDLVEATRRPTTVDGTVEWDVTHLPRRRSWIPHPQCPCRPSAGH